MTTEELLMEVVRMLREREDYFDAEHKNALNRGEFQSASLMLGESLAYSNAGEMLMAALTGNVEILGEYDQYHKEEEN